MSEKEVCRDSLPTIYQGYVLPAYVQDVLRAGHLCFHVHRVVEALDVSPFEQAYGAEGRLAYPPRMMLKVWLYAFALGISSTRRLMTGVESVASGVDPIVYRAPIVLICVE
jgi:transposase